MSFAHDDVIQMETFSALLALCEGNPPVTVEFPSQRPVMRRFDVFFDLRLNKQLSKQSRRLWFEAPSRSVWRHCIANNIDICQWIFRKFYAEYCNISDMAIMFCVQLQKNTSTKRGKRDFIRFGLMYISTGLFIPLQISAVDNNSGLSRGPCSHKYTKSIYIYIH